MPVPVTGTFDAPPSPPPAVAPMKNRVFPLLCSLLTLAALAAPAADTPVEKLTIIAFDTETTGLSPTRGHIVELGAVKFKDGTIIGATNWLINPGEPIPAAATAVHHITDDMVKDKPRFAEIYPEFKAFVGDGVLMAHNAPFDVRFMREEIKRIPGEPLPENKVLDSLRLFRHWMPGLESYQLADLARHVGLEEGQFHRATDDARFTVQIFNKVLAKKAAEKPTLESLDAAGVRTYCIAQPAAEPAPDGPHAP